MALLDHLLELGQQLIRLVLVQLVDPLRERAQRKDALPPRDGVRPDDGVHGRQPLPDVLRAAPRLRVQADLLRVGLGGADEAVADEGGRQALEELLVLAGEAVVDLVPARPERVAPGPRELGQPERGVIGRVRLELDVAVPLGRVVAPLVRLLLVPEHLPARHRRDVADLGVPDPELGRVVQHRVDVQRGRTGLAAELAEPLDEPLLEFVGEVVLGTEEDDTALGDWERGQLATGRVSCPYRDAGLGGGITVDGKVSKELVRIGRIHQVLDDVHVQELAADDGSGVFVLELFERSAELEWLWIEPLVHRGGADGKL